MEVYVPQMIVEVYYFTGYSSNILHCESFMVWQDNSKRIEKKQFPAGEFFMIDYPMFEIEYEYLNTRSFLACCVVFLKHFYFSGNHPT